MILSSFFSWRYCNCEIRILCLYWLGKCNDKNRHPQSSLNWYWRTRCILELQLRRVYRVCTPAQGIHTFFLQNKDFDAQTLLCNFDTLLIVVPSKALRSLQALSWIHKESRVAILKMILYPFRSIPVFGLVLHKIGRAHSI